MITSFARIAVVVWSIAAIGIASAAQREVKTPYYSVTLTPDGTAVESLSVDSLGKGEFQPNALFPPEAKPASQTVSPGESSVNISSDWQFKFSSHSFEMASTYRADAPEQPVVLRF